MDRRRFLRGAGAVTAGLSGCLGRPRPTAEAETEPWRYVPDGRPGRWLTVGDDAVYLATERAVHALGRDGARRWRQSPRGRVNGPPVVGDAVYVPVDVTLSNGADVEAIAALAPATGSVRWYAGVPDSERLETGLLAAGRGAVYAGTFDDWGYRDKRIFAFDAATGDLRWSRSAPGLSGAALLHRDRLYARYGVAIGTNSVHVFDTGTGEQRWSRPATVEGASLEAQGDAAFLLDPDRTLVVVDAADGATRWRYDPGERTGVTSIAVVPDAPFLGPGRPGLYVADDRGYVRALAANSSDSPTAGRLVWRRELVEVDWGRLHAPHVHPWVVPIGGRLFAEVAVTPGSRLLVRLNPVTGGERWRVDWEAGAGGRASALVDDAAFLRARADGDVRVAAVGAGSGDPRWSYPVGEGVSAVGTGGGLFFVLSYGGTVYAFAPDGHP